MSAKAIFSRLASWAVATRKYSSRGKRKITRLIIHHTAGGTNTSNVTLLSTGARSVSASYVLQTTGVLVGIVPEQYRPWTTGSLAADGPSITVETVNSGGAAQGWPVTDAQLETLAQLAADLSTRYGWGRLNRSNVRGHREFMSTSCPGPYLWPRLNDIIKRANEILDGKSSPPSTSRPPAFSGSGAGKYRVTTRGARLRGRAGPGTNHRQTMTAANGYVLDIVETRNGWARSTGGHWYSMQYLTRQGGSTPKPAPPSSTRYRVTTRSARLNGRSGPGTGNRVTMTAAKGTILNIVEIRNGWARSTGGHWYSMQYLTRA